MALEKDGFDSHDDLEAELWAQDDFKSVVKNLCGLFINVYDSKLFFIHLTAREFLTDRLPSGKWKGRLNMTQSHTTMALLCLSYLPHIDWKGSAEETGEELLLAEYSARYWVDHCRPTETEDEVLESVLRFFLQRSEAYTTWLNLFDPDQPGRGEPQDRRIYKIGTLLYYSSLLGLQRIAEVLLAKGADINTPGGRCGNALNGALDGGHEGVAHLLLANGADINVPADELQGTALQYASIGGHRGIVELLLARGTDINALGSPMNALQCASVGDQVGVAELLLTKGADIDAPSKYGTALRLASFRGHEEVVQLLLANGAGVNAPGEDGTASSRLRPKATKRLYSYS